MPAIRRTLALGGLASAMIFGAPVAAHADVPIKQVGWWTRSPAPPTVPDGGVSVGAAPDGDLTVAAVQIDAGGGASGANLHLVETNNGGQLAGLQVCPAEDGWSAAHGDALANAPKDQCATTSVAMTRGADGTWTADVQKLLDGKTGTVSLIIRPAAGAAPVGAFSITFAPPTMAGTVTESSSTSTSADSTSSFATSPDSSTASSPSSSSTSSSSFASNTPSFTASSPSSSGFLAPASPSVATPAPVAAAPQDTAAAQAPAQPGAVAQASSPTAPQVGLAVPVKSVGDSRVTRFTVVLWLLAAAVIGAIAAALSWARAEGRLTPKGLVSLVRRA